MNSKLNLKDVFYAILKSIGIFFLLICIITIIFLSLLIYKGNQTFSWSICNTKCDEKIEFVGNTKGFLSTKSKIEISLYNNDNRISKLVFINCYSMDIQLPYKLENDTLKILISSYMDYKYTYSNIPSKTVIELINLSQKTEFVDDYIKKYNYSIFSLNK